MALPIGLLLFILGIVAVIAWWSAVFPFLQGLVALTLILWGALAILIGISERKAKADFEAAVRDGDAAPPKKSLSQSVETAGAEIADSGQTVA
jgi:hypothetical protein